MGDDRSEAESSTESVQTEHDRSTSRQHLARTLAHAGMDGVRVISHETASDILTPERRRIIAVLQDSRFESVRGLARELNRDKGHVSRDLKLLATHGIIGFDTDGRSKTPHLKPDHLVIEPLF